MVAAVIILAGILAVAVPALIALGRGWRKAEISHGRERLTHATSLADLGIELSGARAELRACAEGRARDRDVLASLREDLAEAEQAFDQVVRDGVHPGLVRERLARRLSSARARVAALGADPGPDAVRSATAAGELSAGGDDDEFL